MFEFIIIMLVKIAVVFGALLLTVAYLTWLERKVIGDIQVRLGPMRVGYHGLLQPIADGLKLLFKEDIIPAEADRTVYLLAPLVAIIPALISFAVIPFGSQVKILGRTIDLYITDVNIGILFIFAVASLGVYGIVLAGWSSNNKYSLLGAMRSSAQMISYELSMGLSIVGVLMMAQSLSLVQIVKAQSVVWFILLQPVGFLIYLICAVAETNRAPFDLPEAETELVAGFHVEYSSMKFALFFLAEYANIVTVSALATTLFLGGWQGPLLPPVAWFLLKVFAFIFLFVWLRATLPRFRYDQLMGFGWKVLLPVSLANILVTGLIMAWR
ncbi:MAG: NADH-quinone oxidoreductase subunit NuoH [candidate division NC10 bacterium]|nr:NADH-quinone oxidoreductase subunit NuoH [candidate division NC10 bacterium]